MIPRLITPRRFGDARGWFVESYSARAMADHGVTDTFVQDNHSFSAERGTVRGLHFQAPPHAQAKLVRCTRGAIWDVAVDLRAGSPDYGRWVAAELSADNGAILYIPIGFAHGFVTLSVDAEVQYKASDFYAPHSEGGILWSDPDCAIDWPLDGANPILSDKDAVLPHLADFTSPFTYDGQPLAPLG